MQDEVNSFSFNVTCKCSQTAAFGKFNPSFLLSIIHDLILYCKHFFICIFMYMYCIAVQSMILRLLCLILGICSRPLSLFLLSSPILCDSDMTFIFKAFVGFETNNKYKICNSMGQQVYFAAEGIFNKSNNIL